jgi:hypothetical protein
VILRTAFAFSPCSTYGLMNFAVAITHIPRDLLRKLSLKISTVNSF